MKFFISAAAICGAMLATTAQASDFACDKMSPIVHDYAGAEWNIYGCNDFHSVRLVGRPDSKMAGTVFTFRWDGNSGYNLVGKSGTDRAASDGAFQTLGSFAAEDVMWLYRETETHQDWKLEKLVAGGQTSPVPEPAPPAFYDHPLTH